VLVAARFGWPDTFPPLPALHTLPQDLGERAVVGAACGGNVATLQALEAAGVGFDTYTDGSTLAATAARNNQVAVLEFLRDRGVDLLAPADAQRGPTPLWEAAKYGRLEAMELLLGQGARPDVASGGIGSTPFVAAMKEGQAEVVKRLAKHTPALATTYGPDGSLTLLPVLQGWAEDAVRIDIIRSLITQYRIDVNAEDTAGDALVHHVARSGSVELMDALGQLGARLAQVDRAGRTPYEIALDKGHDALAARLETSVHAAVRADIAAKEERAKSILTSERAYTLDLIFLLQEFRLPGATAEEKRALLEARWLEAGVEDELLRIWVKHLSASTLRHWSKTFLDTDVHRVMQRTGRALIQTLGWATVEVDLTPPQEARLQPAREVTAGFFPSYNQSGAWRFEQAARVVAKEVTTAELEQCRQYLASSAGKAMAAGLASKALEEIGPLLSVS
ncbi:MAG TPA: ankyrin repeat domain-containing protein, partial [Myxococcota bacterium]|nr:ankyrin repeat domain-containing protein [Myxococcota bacterium]